MGLLAQEQMLERLLLVDDDACNIRMMQAGLDGNGYEFLIATNGADTLRLANEQQPALILLDIMMPDLDGFEVLRRLRAHSRTREIPVIFVTGCLLQADEARGLELGAADYIRKPLSFPILRARVSHQLELVRQRRVLRSLSTLDGLTGIANRRRFDEYLNEQWTYAIRTAQAISLIMCDIDFFKHYNDYYGHLEGDECLKAVAGFLQARLTRQTDLVARWGGEEFCCLMPATGENGATGVAEALRHGVLKLAIPHAQSELTERVTASFGVATIVPRPKTEAVMLIEAADAALYRSKALGRNRVTAYSDLAADPPCAPVAE